MGAFSVFKDRKKEKVSDAGTYYHSLGTVSAIAKYICLFLCLIVLLYGFSFRTDEINSDNFRYLFNYLGEGEANAETYKTIYFDSNDKNRFAIVRGDLAVANDSGSAVYTLAGARRSVDSTLKFDSPRILASAKYMYIYDLGGSDLVIKSPVETIHTVGYHYPIRGVSVTDSGRFVVISEEKTSRSSVYVYDDSFRVIYDCSYGSLYTLSADISDSTDRLLTASVETEGGDFLTTLYLYSLNSKEPVIKQLISGEYPYKTAFTEDGGFFLLTDKSVRFYNRNADLVSTCEFGKEGISSYSAGKKYFIRNRSLSALSPAAKVEIYSTADGKKVWEREFPAGVRFTKSYGSYIFIASGSVITIVTPRDGNEKSFEDKDETVDILWIDEDKVLKLSKGMANVFEFGEMFEHEEENSWAQ